LFFHIVQLFLRVTPLEKVGGWKHLLLFDLLLVVSVPQIVIRWEKCVALEEQVLRAPGEVLETLVCG
jgi:hypothetical protein